MKKIIILVILIVSNGDSSFAQHVSNSDFLRSQAQKVLSHIEQNRESNNDKIIFSILNGKYYLILNDECKEWFVRFIESDSIPVVLDSGENISFCHKLFMKQSYSWNGNFALDSLSVDDDTPKFIGNNISYFAYLDANNKCEREYILPFFSFENPLKENYQLLSAEMIEKFYKFGK